MLDFDTSINQFRLYDGPNDYLGTSVQGQGVGLGINSIAFDFGSTIPTLGLVSYPFTGPSVFYDVGSLLGLTSISTPSAINANFDVAYKALDNGNEVITDTYKMIGGESETFEISGFTAANLNNLNGATTSSGLLDIQASSIAIRVQSSTGNGVSWFTATSVSAVPELHISAMLLFGLVFLWVYQWKFLSLSNKYRLKSLAN